MTPAQLPLASLVPVSGLVHRVLGAAAHGVSEGSRRNARAALEARHELTRQGAEAIAGFPAQATTRRTVGQRSTA